MPPEDNTNTVEPTESAADNQATPHANPEPTETAVEKAPSTQPQVPAGSTVNRHKYDRDMAAKDARIAELEKENGDYKSLRDEFEQFKRAQEQQKTEEALKKAGCHDVVAASARLSEFDGDIDKLKESAPYLFTSTDTSKSTGGTQKGAPDPSDEFDAKLDKAFGLKKG